MAVYDPPWDQMVMGGGSWDGTSLGFTSLLHLGSGGWAIEVQVGVASIESAHNHPVRARRCFHGARLSKSLAPGP